jgi:hypothetical protein
LLQLVPLQPGAIEFGLASQDWFFQERTATLVGIHQENQRYIRKASQMDDIKYLVEESEPSQTFDYQPEEYLIAICWSAPLDENCG